MNISNLTSFHNPFKTMIQNKQVIFPLKLLDFLFINKLFNFLFFDVCSFPLFAVEKLLYSVDHVRLLLQRVLGRLQLGLPHRQQLRQLFNFPSHILNLKKTYFEIDKMLGLIVLTVETNRSVIQTLKHSRT